MAVTLVAELTTEGRKRFADMTVNGRSFIIEEFETGEGGHDPMNPSVALTPDVSVTELPLLTFGPKGIYSKTLPTNFTAQLVCKLTATEAVGTLSNIGLLARINYSPIPLDPLVNTKFLFAIANLPMQNKLAGETRDFNLVINY
jgi:hypothetical protein